jgi:hypothetical protein
MAFSGFSKMTGWLQKSLSLYGKGGYMTKSECPFYLIFKMFARDRRLKSVARAF